MCSPNLMGLLLASRKHDLVRSNWTAPQDGQELFFGSQCRQLIELERKFDRPDVFAFQYGRRDMSCVATQGSIAAAPRLVHNVRCKTGDVAEWQMTCDVVSQAEESIWRRRVENMLHHGQYLPFSKGTIFCEHGTKVFCSSCESRAHMRLNAVAHGTYAISNEEPEVEQGFVAIFRCGDNNTIDTFKKYCRYEIEVVLKSLAMESMPVS